MASLKESAIGDAAEAQGKVAELQSELSAAESEVAAVVTKEQQAQQLYMATVSSVHVTVPVGMRARMSTHPHIACLVLEGTLELAKQWPALQSLERHKRRAATGERVIVCRLCWLHLEDARLESANCGLHNTQGGAETVKQRQRSRDSEAETVRSRDGEEPRR